MEIHAVTGDMLLQESDALLVNIFEGMEPPGGAIGVPVRTLVSLVENLAS